MHVLSGLNKAGQGARLLLVLLFLSTSLLLFFSELVEKSMFIDGVWYAVISRNLAAGNGTFWFPQFSETIFSPFHEHPPLIFGLQSLFFSILGDHWYTERFFSLCHYVLIVMLMVSLWQKASKQAPSQKEWWILPLLLWQVNLVTYYFQPANLLDASITLFGLFAVWLMLKSLERPRAFGWLVMTGIILCMALLSKGVVGLFPLAFFALHWLVCRDYSLKRAIRYTLIVLLSLGVCLSILLFFVPEALESLQQYVRVQLLASLNGERRLYYYRTNRLYIVGQLFIVLIPMWLGGLACWLIFRLGLKSRVGETFVKSFLPDKATRHMSLLFFLIGLSASLPIMISPRQAIPYLLPSIPIFGLAFGLWLAPFLIPSLIWFQERWKKYLYVCQGVGVLVMLLSVWVCAQNWGGKNGRDTTVIQDAMLIGEQVGENQIISSQTYNMYISGYLMRYHKISLDTNNLTRSYLLTLKKEILEDDRFSKIPLPTLAYDLYQWTAAPPLLPSE